MTIGAGLGLARYPFSSADGYWRWARWCDEAGVDSLWQTDRLVSREPFLDCMSVMAALAGATKRLKFGMNVASLGLRDPLQMAKQCATIDYLSGGRLLPAFGLGSNRSRDWVATGTATRARGQRMNEALEIITRLWVEDEVSFSGKHFTCERASVTPKPVQSPLPLWIGGGSEAAIERTGKYGLGWQAAFETPSEAGAIVHRIHAAAARHGRTLEADHFGAGFGVRLGSSDDPIVRRAAEDFEKRTGKPASHGLIAGSAEDVLRHIQGYVDHGLSKFILRPMADGDADMMAQTEALVKDVLPHLAALTPNR